MGRIQVIELLTDHGVTVNDGPKIERQGKHYGVDGSPNRIKT